MKNEFSRDTFPAVDVSTGIAFNVSKEGMETMFAKIEGFEVVRIVPTLVGTAGKKDVPVRFVEESPANAVEVLERAVSAPCVSAAQFEMMEKVCAILNAR